MNTIDKPIDSEDKNTQTEPHKGNSLENCGPVNGCTPTSSVLTTKRIRRPRRDESFTTVAAPRPIACIVDRQYDKWRNISGEEYYPVIGELQNQVGSSLRSIAFHPCINTIGETFIYPQKLDPPHTWANSWNASLAEALRHPHGQWRTVWSDKEAECYQHDLVQSPTQVILEYPGFDDDLEQALTKNIVDSLDHPVIQKTLAETRIDSSDEETY